MGKASLGDIFYVSSKGEVYAPIPHDHAMIVYTARRHIFPIRPKPAAYQLTFLRDDMPMPLKAELFKVCFNRSGAEALQDGLQVARTGRVSFGGLTLETAEAKAEDIIKFAGINGHYADFILEKSS